MYFQWDESNYHEIYLLHVEYFLRCLLSSGGVGNSMLADSADRFMAKQRTLLEVQTGLQLYHTLCHMSRSLRGPSCADSWRCGPRRQPDLFLVEEKKGRRCTSLKGVLKHWFLFLGFVPVSTVLLRHISSPFLRLFQHSLFRFRAPRCPAAFLNTSACGVATTQPRAPLPSKQPGGWYVQLVWISSLQNPLKYHTFYIILFWRFFFLYGW